MNISRVVSLILGITTVALLFTCFGMKLQLGKLRAELHRAQDMVWNYATIREEAVGKDPTHAVECLERLRLPPGSVPFSGAGAVFVEHERQRSIRDIIEYLRTKTGRDFGADPNRWIDGFKDEVGSPQ